MADLAVVHQDDDIRATGKERGPFLQFGFELESFLDVLRLVEHGCIMSTNLLTGKSQNTKRVRRRKEFYT